MENILLHKYIMKHWTGNTNIELHIVYILYFKNEFPKKRKSYIQINMILFKDFLQ